MAKVGEKIKELRTEKGLTQMQLGKMIGVSQKAVNIPHKELYFSNKVYPRLLRYVFKKFVERNRRGILLYWSANVR